MFRKILRNRIRNFRLDCYTQDGHKRQLLGRVKCLKIFGFWAWTLLHGVMAVFHKHDQRDVVPLQWRMAVLIGICFVSTVWAAWVIQWYIQSWRGQQQDVIKLPPRPTHLPEDGHHLVRADTDGAGKILNMSGPDTALEVVQWVMSATSSRSVSSGLWCQALNPAGGDKGFQLPD